jgi:phosphate transport system substrate-binding protein
MTPKFVFTTLALLITAASAQFCGPPAGTIKIRGSSTVYPIANEWASMYKVSCPGVTFAVEATGSTDGAASVCSDENGVDIGTMSRRWDGDEATSENGWRYNCATSDRSAIQIDVATDGLVVVAKKGGSADACIDALGGLTIDQLRWMYSNYTTDELIATGWDSNSITNSDFDDSTHLWSELAGNAACPAAEITISGADDLSGTYEFFLGVVFSDHANGETFAVTRPTNYVNYDREDQLATYVQGNDDAVAFFSFSYYNKHPLTISAAPIKNPAAMMITPNLKTIGDGSYSPFSRRIYMNLYDNANSLRDTAPFIAFGLSHEGSLIVSTSGYIPIPDYEKQIMLARAGADGAVSLDGIKCGKSGREPITIAGSSTVLPIAELWAGIFDAACSVKISVEGGGSTFGATRVCANPAFGSPVMIGDMSRPWKDEEAVTSDGYLYKCVAPGDTSRSAIQIEVAIDGLTFAVQKGGTADACIGAIGGLTTDQIRWMYSSYNAQKLSDSGWSSAALVSSDANDDTHLWSELSTSASCPETEINISGADSLSGSYSSFVELVFTDAANGETFDLARPSGYTNSAVDEDLVDFLLANDDGISYFGFSYYYRNTGTINAVAVKNAKGAYVKPTPVTVEDGSYSPFARRLSMNLLNDDAALDNIRPFIAFAMTDEGASLVESTGYTAIPLYDRVVMLSRAGAVGGIDIRSVKCGPAGQSIRIAGSSTVFPIAQIWAGIYELACGVTVTVEGGGSSVGAGRVCGNTALESPVDIGDMSRQWTPAEGFSSNGYLFNCKTPGDTSRSAMQIEVAVDGLSVVTKAGGVAETCIKSLGGLTIDQLRWIYSSYDETKLSASGWNEAAVPNSDNNSDTHLWSELLDSPYCPATEIIIAGADALAGAYDHFLKTVLIDNEKGEVFDSNRPNGYTTSDVADELLVYFIREQEYAIGFCGYAYYYSNRDVISAMPIKNNLGKFVVPSPETVGDGSYSPLSRRIYMNLLTSTLANTRPFVEFGLNNANLVAITGYLPIPVVDRSKMFSRLAGESPATAPTTGNTIAGDDDDSMPLTPEEIHQEEKDVAAIVGGVFGGFFGIVLIISLVEVCRRMNSGKDETFVPGIEDNIAPASAEQETVV